MVLPLGYVAVGLLSISLGTFFLKDNPEVNKIVEDLDVGNQAKRMFKKAKNKIHGTCDEDSFPDISSEILAGYLKRELFGQDHVINLISKVLVNFIENPRPTSALVFSFHGSVGTGKNFLVSLLRNILFGSEENPKGYLYISSSVVLSNFKDDSEIISYIIHQIKLSVQSCPQRSLIVLDEIDKFSSVVLSSLKPFMDFLTNVDGVDYKRSIFILMSNIGDNELTSQTLGRLNSGKDRFSFSQKDIEIAVKTAMISKGKALMESSLVTSDMIDFYIGFLPLEVKHVNECIKKECVGACEYNDCKKRVNSQMHYIPPNDPIFSYAGCKRVKDLVLGNC